MPYRKPRYIEAVIPASSDTSGIVAFHDSTSCGIGFPAAMDGATISFLVCEKPDGTFRQLRDSDNNVVSITFVASVAVGITGSEADALAPWPYFKIVSASSESAAVTLIVQKK